MLAKKSETKSAPAAKTPKGPIAKANKVAKKGNQAKKLKEKQGANVKKAVKDGLVKAPAPVSPKVGAAPVKKVLDEKAIAARKEKLKQKKLEKKLKKAASKKSAAPEDGAEKEVTKKAGNAGTQKVKKQPQQNGTKAEATDSEVVSKAPAGKAKNKKKKQTTEGIEKTKAPLVNPEHTFFVGNLPTNTKRNQLVKLFSSFGPILGIRFRTATGKVIFKHKMRKEAGALNAYIALSDADSVAKALELNGVEFKGNHLRLTKTGAKLEEEVDSKRMLFVGNLKYSATDDKLRQIFSSCGEIEYVRTIQQPEKNGCSGVAFVCFKNPDSVGLALELKGTILDERPIHVERYSVNKLGAKAKRDSEAEKTNAQAPQKGKKPQKKQGNAKKPQPSAGAEGKKKKSEFRGVKSDGIKKKQKKVPSEMKKLAKKIAPKSDD